MPLTRVVMELGRGADIRGRDWTKAACRAVEDALRRNSLTVADAFDLPREAMHVEIVIAAGDPAAVDVQAVAALLPYGSRTVRVEQGGLVTPERDGRYGPILANAALLVSLDLPEAGA